MGVFKSYSLYRISDIEEILQWKVVGTILNVPKLSSLLNPFLYLVGIGRKSHIIDFSFAKGRQATLLEQISYLVKSYLCLKILWVYHCCMLFGLQNYTKKL